MAMVRTISIGSSGAMSAIGVPFIGISMLIGTDSGGSSRSARVRSMSMRSSAVSPMPTMPPEQTLIPAARTRSRVFKRSAKVRLVMTSE
ncbi:hypothetical protein D3C85_1552670 [compost metagenome]